MHERLGMRASKGAPPSGYERVYAGTGTGSGHGGQQGTPPHSMLKRSPTDCYPNNSQAQWPFSIDGLIQQSHPPLEASFLPCRRPTGLSSRQNQRTARPPRRCRYRSRSTRQQNIVLTMAPTHATTASRRRRSKAMIDRCL